MISNCRHSAPNSFSVDAPRGNAPSTAPRVMNGLRNRRGASGMGVPRQSLVREAVIVDLLESRSAPPVAAPCDVWCWASQHHRRLTHLENENHAES